MYHANNVSRLSPFPPIVSAKIVEVGLRFIAQIPLNLTIVGSKNR